MHFDPDHLIAAIPFAATLTKNPPEQRPLLTRLVEQGALAAIAAALAIYANDARQDAQIAELRTAIAELKADTRAQLAETHTLLRAILTDQPLPPTDATPYHRPKTPRGRKS